MIPLPRPLWSGAPTHQASVQTAGYRYNQPPTLPTLTVFLLGLPTYNQNGFFFNINLYLSGILLLVVIVGIGTTEAGSDGTSLVLPAYSSVHSYLIYHK